MFLSFCVLDDFFPFFKKIWFSAILGPSYCGIGATIRIGQEMLCIPYAGFFEEWIATFKLDGVDLSVTYTFRMFKN